ncbi:MAG: hypothetical protein NZM38_07350 [Cytophagales bacterium]|nr:hypothetical protein [Cytophagales bacterium]MDW8384573.1 hypothetical protein [Flammeovirgaceae bacterium]
MEAKKENSPSLGELESKLLSLKEKICFQLSQANKLLEQIKKIEKELFPIKYLS